MASAEAREAAPTHGSPVTDFLNEELCLENTSEVRLLSQKVFKELFNNFWSISSLDTDVQRSVSNESQYCQALAPNP